MGFDRFNADIQGISDFLITFAFCDELNNFALARGQLDGVAGGWGLVGIEKSCEDELGDAPRKERLMVEKGFDALDEQAGCVGFHDERAGAGDEHLADEPGGVVHGQNKDLGLGAEFADLTGGLDSVEFRHREVEDRDVGLVLGGEGNGLATVPGFGADGPLSAYGEDLAKPLTNQFVIVGDE